MFKRKTPYIIVNVVLLFVLTTTMVINQVVAYKINKSLGIRSTIENIVKITMAKSNTGGNIKMEGELMQDAIQLIISEGVPEIYGEELGISFDRVQEAINVMRKFDPTYGKEKKIILTEDELNRYIDIAIRISCEYCCGAKSIINKDGKAACGCAHSWAMRGLAAYLVQNHGDEYTNDEVLRELARWKGVYFPKQMFKKMTEQFISGNYTPDIASLIIDIDLPDYGGEGGKVPLPSEIENLPSMIGGC